MKLYLISQECNPGYDTYDSAVVCAENEDSAKTIHPSGGTWYDDTWCPQGKVEVLFLGDAIPESSSGVVLASFNAG